jgi:hypothetical protein
MAEIKPDLSEWSRCISVHWSLPVQCVLPCTHRQNWHEAWHPESGNRIRYRRAYGTFRTEELIGDGWSDLGIPPPVSERDELLAKLTEAEADRDRAREIAVALEQADERVRELHAKFTCGCGDDHEIGCKECRDSDYPCPTILALGGGEAL